MRWRKPRRDDAPTSLFDDLPTDVARHTDRPPTTPMQRLRDIYSPPVAFFVYEHAGGTATTKSAYVPSFAVHPRNGRIAGRMGIGWNGELLTVMSADGHVDSWTPRAGGVLREFRGDPERTPGFIIRNPGSGQVAEIAAVTSRACASWLLFLDERRHQLADIPIAGFDEPRLMRLADARPSVSPSVGQFWPSAQKASQFAILPSGLAGR